MWTRIGLILLLFPVAVFADEPAEDESGINNIVEEFVSPDKSCTLRYEGASGHGEGVFYHVEAGGKSVLQTWFRYGPMLEWVSAGFAELKVPTGSPFYHSYYYDCVSGALSVPVEFAIAVDIKRGTIAAQSMEEILFFRWDANKPFLRIPAPGLTPSLPECVQNAVFIGNVFTLKASCDYMEPLDISVDLAGYEKR